MLAQSTLLLSLLGLAQAMPQPRTPPETFDYLVVGAGTGGLALASRLSENFSIRVGVLEAGESALGDPIVDTPGYFGRDIATKYDWNITALGSGDIGNVFWPRGKGVGGSSLLNFLVWDRASTAEYDAWEELGSKGWNWKNLYKYMRKAEDFHSPTERYQNETGIDVVPGDYGHKGPVQVSFPRYLSKQVSLWVDSLRSLGIETNNQPLNGDNKGASLQPANINPYNSTKSYSAPAYYFPYSERPNLHLITGAQATKINFSKKKNSNGNLKARSVSYVKNGQAFNISVTTEVILASGVHSSALLELSGIGNSTLLSSANITTLIDNPNVGENHQDHTYSAAAFELANGTVTLDSLANATFAAEQAARYQANKTSILQETVPSIAYINLRELVGLKKETRLIAEAIKWVAEQGNVAYKSVLRKQLEFLTIHKKSVSQMELIGIDGFFATSGAPEPNKTYITLLAAQQHAFSRGSIHINASDPSGSYPIFTHGYYQAPFDVEVATEGTKYLCKIAATPQYSSYITKELLPGQGVDLKNYTTGVGFTTEYHNIGTTSMLPRNEGGVVDNHLKVYGTSNVRVCDASIIPIHISAHIQATVYGIAEALADIISGKFEF